MVRRVGVRLYTQIMVALRYRNPRTAEPDEVRALAELAFVELAKAATGAGAVHRAIADRVYSAVRLDRKSVV